MGIRTNSGPQAHTATPLPAEPALQTPSHCLPNAPPRGPGLWFGFSRDSLQSSGWPQICSHNPASAFTVQGLLVSSHPAKNLVLAVIEYLQSRCLGQKVPSRDEGSSGKSPGSVNSFLMKFQVTGVLLYLRLCQKRNSDQAFTQALPFPESVWAGISRAQQPGQPPEVAQTCIV